MKKVFSVIMICLIAFSVMSCDMDSTKKADSDSKPDKKVEKETAKKYKSWKKKVDWADDKDYMIAVGIKDYDGDILQPGNYIFKSNLTKKKIESKEKKGQTPVVWDIYVSKNQYKNKRELKKLSFIFLKKFLNFMLVKFLFWNKSFYHDNSAICRKGWIVPYSEIIYLSVRNTKER